MDIYIAKRALIARIDGRVVHVYRGNTVREGHKLLAMLPDAFKLLKVDFDLPVKASARGRGRADEGAQA